MLKALFNNTEFEIKLIRVKAIITWQKKGYFSTFTIFTAKQLGRQCHFSVAATNQDILKDHLNLTSVYGVLSFIYLWLDPECLN